ncbi:MAG TPA: NAD(P)-dependent oxidoreductase [Usitatibacter sp.]|nr:NAD(P)-dependent oxidoreductase [Usitatibacter sp.]
MSAKVAFLGLGVMGFPMAGHLKAKGYEVTVYNRTASKAQAWVERHGGKSAPTPAAAAKDADFVMLMVGNDKDVLEVALGKEGALSGMKGAVLVDHTTASADAARKIFAAAKEVGVDFIDAPVSGGQAGAENGKLTVMCGGEPAAFERAKPVMDSYGRAVTLLGPSGAGQLTKMVNQICIAGLVQALSEGIAFAEKAGLDANLVLDVISKGAAQSWQMENRGKTMHERKFTFGFAVDWMRKDLGICLGEAKRNGAKLPITQIIDQYYGEVQKAGGSRWDTSSLITRL